ncbi:imidazolonepropionase [Alteromonas sp. ASW11-19]|uniref:Imidazolonepropionase n=1 Tax=Alteromonas salexigens TaxID=2982530 RepID=A0ABT2VLR2_9ALTE|nr:imidazolonepropionase [Alteromonas salexigens]MCU7554257.1 imidazolonepropionase [Alteromonas salexigens]
MHNLLVKNARIASMQDTAKAYGELSATDIRIRNGIITELGSGLTAADDEHCVDADGQWCLPGLVDCHTHLVYAGNRSDEFAQRLTGVSYQQISKQGGGISSTVRATRQASADTLHAEALRRAQRLVEEGVTTVEIKSGYGLDQETELRMLDVAGKVAETLGIQVRRTFLGAHALPPGENVSADDYITFVCDTMIPHVAQHALADAVDVFCESVGFSLAETRRVFEAAKQHGLAVKGHVEQLSNSNGATLAASYNALSVDHVEYLDPADVQALAAAGTVAVLLPGAFYYLKETQLPPVEALRNAKVPMAVATDFNPGTSPVASLLTCANMACVQFGLTVEEALRGITVNGARALGLTNTGLIAEQYRGDLTLWDVPDPSALVYEINGYRPSAIICGGKHVR